MKRVTIGAPWHVLYYYDRKYHNYLRKIKATGIETYVKWSDIEKEPGQIDFSNFDRQLEIMKKYGVKWQPFLICGPWYSLPYWFHKSSDCYYFKCLEHSIESGIQSIWNPYFKKYVVRFLNLFYQNYKSKMDLIDSLLLGISGDYGEAIYPVVGNWDGMYHTHKGFWCGDDFAIIDFRDYLKEKFEKIENLNKRWNTSYRSFDEIKPFLKENSPSRPAMIDMVYWYRTSMIKWVEFWVKEARKLWKEKDIYLVMGGDSSAKEGQHYFKAAEICSKYNVGIRDTNARDNFPYLHTYQAKTSVATNFYGNYCSYESSSGSNEKLIVARIFTFIITNAREFHEYSFHSNEKVINNFKKYRKLMEINFKRKVDIAVFYPEPYVNWIHEYAISWEIKNLPWGLPPELHNSFYNLRYYFDFDIVDDSLIRNGILEKYRVLIIPSFSIIEDDIKELIENRIKNKEKIIVFGKETPEDVYGNKINFGEENHIVSLRKLLKILKNMGINVKERKDGIFEVFDEDGRIICYDEIKNKIFWKRR
ncbi:MAG TPA: family 14 glycosylhydrolase [bacterium]|nr:family 14 glycosylhydrolase [bacterium]HOM27715.1 family 14 glycosylhydrolase [bacterium]